MTSPDPSETLRQINVAREQSYQNIALTQAQLTLATKAADAASKDRAAIQAIAQQTVSVDTSVGTRVFAGDVMVFGDTGARDVTSDMVRNGAIAAAMRIRRTGYSVDAIINLRVPVGWVSGSIGFQFPPGFRPVSGLYWPKPYDATLNGYLIAEGKVQLFGGNPAAEGYFRGFYSFETPDPWPSTLPGTPL